MSLPTADTAPDPSVSLAQGSAAATTTGATLSPSATSAPAATTSATPTSDHPLAYAKTLVAVSGTLVASLLAPTASGAYGAWQIAAAIAIALIGDLGVYLVRNGDGGLPAYAKAVISWVSTILAAVPLALQTYEGASGATSGLTLGGLDGHALLVVLALAGKSVLVGVLPNLGSRAVDAAVETLAISVPVAAPATHTGAALVEPTPADRASTQVLQAVGSGSIPTDLAEAIRATTPASSTSLLRGRR